MPAVEVPYQLKITTASGVKSFPIRRDGFTLTFAAGKAGKHSASSCRVSVRGSEALSAIMYGSGLLDAQVVDSSGAVLFTGVIRPYASITAEPMYLGDLQLEVMDYTEKLHKKVYAELDDDSDVSEAADKNIIYAQNWDGYSICSASDSERSIVHQICALAGITITEAPLLDVKLNRFSLKEGEYLDDILGTLLYEYVYDYRFDAEGRMHIFQTGTIIETEYDADGNADSTEHPLSSSKTVSVFRNSFSISRSDDAVDGALVKFDKYKAKEDVCIYEETRRGWPGIVAGTTVWATADKDVNWDLSQIEDDNGKEIILSNFWVEGKNITWGLGAAGANELEISNCDDKKGHLSYSLWAVGGLFFVELKYRIRIYADISYTREETKTVGYAGENAEEYSARYIESIAYAMSLASVIRNRGQFGAFSYKFRSFEQIEPGTIVSLAEGDLTGVSTTARIIKRTLSDDTGLFEYEAEGYGSAAFSKPAIDRDDDVSRPESQPDFFLMQVSESNILPEDEDSQPVYAEAWGTVFSKYKATPRWYLNGALLQGYSSLIIQFSKLMLAPGINRLRCEADYDGETYSVEKVINYISTDLEIQMQFAVLPDGQSPDSSTVWQNTQPVPQEGESAWLRFKTSSSSEWIVIKMTSKDGGNPVVFFQWAATPYIAPDEGVDLLTWDDMAITWEVNGEVMGFVLDSGSWETLVPDKPFGLNYLWVKYWNYQESQWDYFCTTGTPAMDFNLIVNPQTFKLTSRGVTKESDENDKCQRINVRCQRLNTTAPITWSVEPADETLIEWERVNDADDSEIVIIISPMVALPNITIHCSIADIDVGKYFVVSGVQEGKAEEMYLGIYTSGATLPNDTAEGPLMAGDHLIIETAEGVRDPYYWNGSEWVIADGNMPVSFGFKVLQDSLWDSVNAPSSSTTLSAVNIFAANMAANLLFSYYAKIRNLHVGDGSPFSFEIYDYQNGEKVTPVIRAKYNGTVIFQIDPSTGNIFFGKPNSGLTEPDTGFMYRASDQTIRSKSGRFSIDANGYLSAFGVDVSGAITATSGSFKGSIECQSFKVMSRNLSSTITISTTERSPKQLRTLINSLSSALAASSYNYYNIEMANLDNRLLEVQSSNISGLRYILFINPQSNNTSSILQFYNEDMEPLYLRRNAGLTLMEDSSTMPSSQDSFAINTLSDSAGIWVNSSISISFRLYSSDSIKAQIVVNPTDQEKLAMNVGEFYADANGNVKIRLGEI